MPDSNPPDPTLDGQSRAPLMEVDGTPRTAERSADTAAITRDVISLTKTLMGRGPVKGKTYLENECVLVLMREGHTISEESMADRGRQRRVAQTRVDLSEDDRQQFIDVIERHTGRKVVGFMSSSQQAPSLISQVFVLDTSPLLKISLDGASI